MSDTTYMPEDEYLVREPQAEYKHEYRHGRMVAMSGASRAHNRIALNVASSLSHQLKGRPCEAFMSDMRVKVTAAHFYTYPDVSAVCGEPSFDGKDKNALVNPAVIVEVLSESTEAYDRGDKFEYYKKLESLQEYVLISQERVQVDVWVRRDGRWELQSFTEFAEVVEFRSVGCRVAVSEIYDKVEPRA